MARLILALLLAELCVVAVALPKPKLQGFPAAGSQQQDTTVYDGTADVWSEPPLNAPFVDRLEVRAQIARIITESLRRGNNSSSSNSNSTPAPTPTPTPTAPTPTPTPTAPTPTPTAPTPTPTPPTPTPTPTPTAAPTPPKPKPTPAPTPPKPAPTPPKPAPTPSKGSGSGSKPPPPPPTPTPPPSPPVPSAANIFPDEAPAKTVNGTTVKPKSPPAPPAAAVVAKAVVKTTVKQTVSFSKMEESSYKGKVKKIYDTGYGITLNIYDKALKVWVGGTVDSKAAAIKRRGKGCTVAFEATLAGTEGQEKAKMAAFVSPAELVTSINEASVAVLTPAEQQVFSSFAPKATDVVVETPTVKAESTSNIVLPPLPTTTTTTEREKKASIGALGIVIILLTVIATIACMGGLYYMLLNDKPKPPPPAPEAPAPGVTAQMNPLNSPNEKVPLTKAP